MAPPAPDRPALMEEFLTGEEGSYDSVMVDGEIVWDSVSNYLPTPLEVLRNPWMQWVVLLPRDINGPEYVGIRQVAPVALRALGLDTGLTHMEWFRRPDGSVAVSEVGARPPGAQITSMLCYAHDFDLYRAWAKLMIDGTFAPPVRQWSAGTVYLRGQGAGLVRAVHGLDRLPAWVSELVVDSRLPSPGQPSSGSYEGDGHITVRDRADQRGRRRAQGSARHRPGRARLTAVNVLMISPGYPAEMAFFTRGLARAGATVIGLGDQSADALPSTARDALTHYIHVGSLAADDHVAAVVRELARRTPVDAVECLWEPYMLLAARLREELGLPGLTVAQTVPFRDKERMKQLLDAAGLRTPWHTQARTVADVWAAAERVGYPLIVKPIDGAGSADTYRADSAAELDSVLPMIRHVPLVSVEEFVDGEEFTYDTICAGGQVLFENICQYHPRPLVTKMHEWVSPVTVALRDLDDPALGRGPRARRQRDRRARVPGRVHPHGVVPQGRRRGGVRRDRRAPAGRAHGRRDELRHRRRPVHRLGAGGHPGPDPPARHPALQRGQHLQAGQRRRPDRRLRGPGRLLAEYGDHVVAVDLLPVGAPPPRLARHPDRRRHGHRPPPRPAPDPEWPSASPPTSASTPRLSRLR